MSWTEYIVPVGVPTVGGVFAFLRFVREQATKRQVEVTRQFADLLTLAHARTERSEGHEVGISEQIGAVYLVAAFGRRSRIFADAAAASLVSMTEWPTTDERVVGAAREAHKQLPRGAKNRHPFPPDGEGSRRPRG